ncbi:MAG TPA: VIT1/CCC1 transporter family protein [Methylophilaceae bacterium]|jgi:VIT1/CCC1 family predicted Fe2+/Mn2+ transporter
MSHQLDSWLEEKRSAYLYRIIANNEKVALRQQLFSKLAHEAESQSELWAQLAKEGGYEVPQSYQPELRARIVAWLISALGAGNIKPVLAAIKIRGLSVYSNSRKIGYHPLPNSIEDVGASHRGTSSSGGLRAAVFGVNDGLVSIACLVMGVVGASSSNSTILLTGVAGLLAGAFSMAAGEYISMRSQREMFEYQIGLERDELAQYPEEEAEELALIYIARGLPDEEARALAQHMIADPELGLDTLAREELGLNPDELGSPWLAASASFFAFTAGGLIPMLPYLLSFNQFSLQLSIALTTFALFGVGAVLSLFTGRSAILGGLRMLLIGGTAGLLTYSIGNWMGASLH